MGQRPPAPDSMARNPGRTKGTPPQSCPALPRPREHGYGKIAVQLHLAPSAPQLSDPLPPRSVSKARWAHYPASIDTNHTAAFAISAP